jgi:uncharacterized protein (TIGR02118 family)
MLKLTVLYGHPENAQAFDAYYAETHTPIALKIPGLLKFEKTQFLPGPDGSKPAYHLMAELYFAGPDELQNAFASAEGQASSADLANFATGGVTILVGMVS